MIRLHHFRYLRESRRCANEGYDILLKRLEEV
jgi:hypothetical protein